ARARRRGPRAACQGTPIPTQLGDAQSYAPSWFFDGCRSPPWVGSPRGPGEGACPLPWFACSLGRGLELAEPIAATLDVQHVAAVQEAVEQRRGHDLVASQDLGPLLHGLVGRDHRAAALVAIAHHAEEQARGNARHRPDPKCFTVSVSRVQSRSGDYE